MLDGIGDFMEINWGFFQLCSWKDRENIGSGFWFRLFGVGLIFRSGPMSFSERYSHKKQFRFGRNWRMEKLNARQ